MVHKGIPLKNENKSYCRLSLSFAIWHLAMTQEYVTVIFITLILVQLFDFCRKTSFFLKKIRQNSRKPESIMGFYNIVTSNMKIKYTTYENQVVEALGSAVVSLAYAYITQKTALKS